MDNTFWINELQKLGFEKKDYEDGSCKLYFYLDSAGGYDPNRRKQFFWTQITAIPIKDVWKVVYSRSEMLHVNLDTQVYETGEQMHSDVVYQMKKKPGLFGMIF